jgi:hypothetical protein
MAKAARVLAALKRDGWAETRRLPPEAGESGWLVSRGPGRG